jgi:hypothetical protein
MRANAISLSDHESLAECLATGEDARCEEYPLSPRRIAREQEKDKELQESMIKSPEAYSKVTMENSDVATVNQKWSYPSNYEGVLWRGPTTTWYTQAALDWRGRSTDSTHGRIW